MRALVTLGLCAVSWLSACNDDLGNNFPKACAQDSDCQAGSVCVRAGQCFPQDQTRSIAVVWTVGGQPASDAACGIHADFTLQFDSDVGYSYGYAPVPCRAGKFTVDKIATIVNFVEMFDNAGSGAAGQIVDATDQATLDLSIVSQ